MRITCLVQQKNKEQARTTKAVIYRRGCGGLYWRTCRFVGELKNSTASLTARSFPATECRRTMVGSALAAMLKSFRNVVSSLSLAALAAPRDNARRSLAVTLTPARTLSRVTFQNARSRADWLGRPTFSRIKLRALSATSRARRTLGGGISRSGGAPVRRTTRLAGPNGDIAALGDVASRPRALLTKCGGVAAAPWLNRTAASRASPAAAFARAIASRAFAARATDDPRTVSSFTRIAPIALVSAGAEYASESILNEKSAAPLLLPPPLARDGE